MIESAMFLGFNLMMGQVSKEDHLIASVFFSIVLSIFGVYAIRLLLPQKYMQFQQRYIHLYEDSTMDKRSDLIITFILSSLLLIPSIIFIFLILLT